MKVFKCSFCGGRNVALRKWTWPNQNDKIAKAIYILKEMTRDINTKCYNCDTEGVETVEVEMNETTITSQYIQNLFSKEDDVNVVIDDSSVLTDDRIEYIVTVKSDFRNGGGQCQMYTYAN